MYFNNQISIMQNMINITFGSKALTDITKQLNKNQYSSIFILVDTNTKKNCLLKFIDQTRLDNPTIILMRAGEENKHLQTCEEIWNQLSKFGADRNSVLINLGGGVVTDLGGFVACTFKRGIDFYNIPTTLLSMVDASVGGKTGIDLGSLKNQIGIIREPKQVIIDTQWLKTLPENELRSGFAEMLKHGLIANPSYWNELINIKQLDAITLSKFIKSSVAIKEKVVLKDPSEKSLRKILNFGHTMGHAIESYFMTDNKKERLLHGEAISVGMILESFLSVNCCNFPEKDAIEIKKCFSRYYPHVKISKTDREGILSLLRHDKKNKAGKINFVLLESIGKAKIDVKVKKELFDKAFDFYDTV